MATNSPTQRSRVWRDVALYLIGLLIAVGIFLMVMQILQLKAINQQLSSSLAASQAQTATLKADNATMAANGAQQAVQTIAIQGQLAALQSQMGSVLGDERVGRAFFESFLGLLDGTSQHENCSSARFLVTTASRQQCAYIESYYDQIDAIASPYIGK